MAQEDCLEVLREKPMVWISTLEIHREVVRRGGDLRVNTIRMNLRRLAGICDNVEMRKSPSYKYKAKYQYRWVPDDA